MIVFKEGDKVINNRVLKFEIPPGYPATVIKTGLTQVSLVEFEWGNRLWADNNSLEKKPALIDADELIKKLKFTLGSDGNYDTILKVVKSCK